MSSSERQTQLVDAAMQLLAAEGARAVTVRRIAQEVGITDGAVFRHFKDTRALFDAAVDRFDAALPPIPPPGPDPRARLGQFFVERVEAVQAQPEILGLATSDRLQTLVSDRAAKKLRLQMEKSFAFVVAALRACRVKNPRVAAFMVTGAMRGAAKAKMKPKTAWRQVSEILLP